MLGRRPSALYALVGMVVVRIAQGKFQEEGWLMMDNLGLLQQLGVVPPVGQSTP